jgi:cell division septation protein DedD
VQVGAFRRQESSEQVARDLESRGYQTYVESLTNARGSLLHTVRFGRYADRKEAAQAASEFRARERMAAIVQPAGSL